MRKKVEQLEKKFGLIGNGKVYHVSVEFETVKTGWLRYIHVHQFRDLNKCLVFLQKLHIANLSLGHVLSRDAYWKRIGL